MSRTHLFASVIAWILVLGPLSQPSEAGERTYLERDEIVAAGLAKPSLRGHSLQSGTAVLRSSGEMSMTLHYRRGTARSRFSFTFRVRWRERAAGGTKQAWDLLPGGAENVYWHPRQQVSVTYTYGQMGDHPAIDESGLHALARVAADQVALPALLWPAPFPELALEREAPSAPGFFLSNTNDIVSPTRHATTVLGYRTDDRVVVSNGDRRRESQGFEIKVLWYPIGKSPSSGDESTWRVVPQPTEWDGGRRAFTGIRSRTHYAKVEVRGVFYGQEGRKKRFQDGQHFEAAMKHARSVLARIERFVAQPRQETPEHGEGTQGVEPVPPETTQGSGTIVSANGRFAVVRGGRRVALKAGRRVALGDVLITGGGTVVIRFDNPDAGTDGSLIIAPRSKVKIEVGPYDAKRRKRPTRFHVSQGAIRFTRPHDHRNPRIELSWGTSAAVFGIVGTDAALIRQEFGSVIAIRDGMGDLTVAGRPVRVVTPISAMFVANDGTILESKSLTEARFLEDSKAFGLAP